MDLAVSRRGAVAGEVGAVLVGGGPTVNGYYGKKQGLCICICTSLKIVLTPTDAADSEPGGAGAGIGPAAGGALGLRVAGTVSVFVK